MPGARAAAEGARVQRLSELAAVALQAAALQAVLTLADRLMEMSCADLLEATKPPPALVGKADESWGVFGSDSEEDAEDGGGREADGAELAEPASGAAEEGTMPAIRSGRPQLDVRRGAHTSVLRRAHLLRGPFRLFLPVIVRAFQH